MSLQLTKDILLGEINLALDRDGFVFTFLNEFSNFFINFLDDFMEIELKLFLNDIRRSLLGGIEPICKVGIVVDEPIIEIHEFLNVVFDVVGPGVEVFL